MVGIFYKNNSQSIPTLPLDLKYKTVYNDEAFKLRIFLIIYLAE